MILLEENRIPVIILTGFLGAGKTTLLNRLLREEHGHRLAVIENEVGEIGIDAELLHSAPEQIVQANNGCLCCTIRGDLLGMLHALWERRDQFDRVVIETTGVADPSPILQTFWAEQFVYNHYRLHRVISVVDAAHFDGAAESRVEPWRQVSSADLVVVNKVDLVQPQQAKRLVQSIQSVNRLASIVQSSRADFELSELWEGESIDVSALRKTVDSKNHHHHQPHEQHTHRHLEDIETIALEDTTPLDPHAVQLWLKMVARLSGDNLYRTKGLLSLQGMAYQWVVQGTQSIFDFDRGQPWGSRPRISRLVFIGKGLDKAMLQRGLASCRSSF